MLIQVHTDHNIGGREKLIEHVRGVVEDAVDHFANQVTSVEVHLRDENGPKNGRLDKRCMMEVRVEHRAPIAVTHHADDIDEAITGAADKLRRSLEHELARLHERR